MEDINFLSLPELGTMVLGIMNVMPRSPVVVFQSSFLYHIQALEFSPRQRIYGGLQLRVLNPENQLRNTIGILNIVGAHSTDCEAKESGKEKSLLDCGVDKKSIAGSIVALGKFDALHVGHRALAVQASKMGSPVLLSFTGMAEVLNWERRLPLVAPCDRKRIMSLWDVVCGGGIPQEHQLEFAKVRSLSPRDFVEKLARKLHVKGVVAGANYRFGYKASGDASDLVQLCGEFGLKVFILDPVMDESEKIAMSPKDFERLNIREKGQVSSTRVRKALSVGEVKRVAKLLGRDHRLVLTIDDCTIEGDSVFAPISNALNQAPGDGVYSSRVCLKMNGNAGVEEHTLDGDVKIGDAQVVVSLRKGSFEKLLDGQRYLCVDFQDKSTDVGT